MHPALSKINSDTSHLTWKLNSKLGDKEIMIEEINLESYNGVKDELVKFCN